MNQEDKSMRWSWKGPVALVGLVLVFLAAIGIYGGIDLATSGVGWLPVVGAIVAGFLPLALFIASGFVAAKIIQRRKAKQL